ncbi:MAG TPA: amidohydrolase family protein [Streptosporangiaceae bacterium]
MKLIDHHVHGAVTRDLDFAGFESQLAEGHGVQMFDTQLGFAIRRWCAPVLDLLPFAPAEDYVRRRSEIGVEEVNRRLLVGADVDMWLVDTGFKTSELTTPEEMAAISGRPSKTIVRLDAVAEQVFRDGVTAAGFADAFGAALAAETLAAGAVGYKSIVAYRHGFDFDPARPTAAEVSEAAGRLLRALSADPAARVEDPVLERHLIWTAVDTRLPLQFHVGFGDTDLRMHRSDPSLLHDFLMATETSGISIMLLHCYPWHRVAGHLANVFPHVYMDLGAVLNHVGARSAAILAESLELTPFRKMLYSSDAFGLPELHYLGAIGFRRDLDQVIADFVAAGLWAGADAKFVANLIGSENAARVYGLELS